MNRKLGEVMRACALGILGLNLLGCEPKMPEKPHCPGAIVKRVDAQGQAIDFTFKTAAGFSMRVTRNDLKFIYAYNKRCEVARANLVYAWDGEKLAKFPPPASRRYTTVEAGLEFDFFHGTPKAELERINAWRYEDAIPLPQYGLTLYPKWSHPRKGYVPPAADRGPFRGHLHFAVDGTWDHTRSRPAEFYCQVGDITKEMAQTLSIPDRTFCRARWGFVAESDSVIDFYGAVVKDAQKIFTALDGTIQSYIVKE